MEKSYIAIDLKSFYASVECAERRLDPLTANLVVADESRTEKTICLAVSPALKAYGIPGRARLFEVNEKVREINRDRLRKAPGHKFSGVSYNSRELAEDPSRKLGCIIAPPQMSRYMEISTQIYKIYLKYIAPEDILVYSIDEVFIDVTSYLRTYNMTARELAMTMIEEVLTATNITATAGIGTNLFLCKIAMDIVAKKIPPEKGGVRIAELDERSFREQLWDHRPLTDFWRVGKGYARKLEANGMFTMGDVARRSVYDEASLYKLFGVNAELLIDHAWGWEPCTMQAIKSYRPESSSVSSGQVLPEPYEFGKARLIVREMTDALVLNLVEKKLVTDQMVLTVCYDTANLKDAKKRAEYSGPVSDDFYGRKVPKPAHGSTNLGKFTSSTEEILSAVTKLFERIVDPGLLVRRMYVVANRVVPEENVSKAENAPEQMNLFTDYEAVEKQQLLEKEKQERERRKQDALISIKNKYGKNAILRGMNYEEGATARERNNMVGGHKA